MLPMDEASLVLSLFGIDEEDALEGLEALVGDLPICQWCAGVGLAHGMIGPVAVRVCDDHKTVGAHDLPIAKLVRALQRWRREAKSDRITLPDMEAARRRQH
jgi:hypothetical protein